MESIICILGVGFAEEIRAKGINEHDILVSYDVVSLFTNVPLDETIEILVNKAFKDNWFNSQYNLNISRQDLTDLLNIATKDQLFQFEGTLYEQFDGVAMGSPLGPLIANVFMCSIEEQLDLDGKMPMLNKYGKRTRNFWDVCIYILAYLSIFWGRF